MFRAYFFTLGLLLAFFVAGCASDSYFTRLGNALVNGAPHAAEAVANNPTPLGIAAALVGWIGGGLGVAGTGAAVTMHVRKRRRRRAAALAAALPVALDAVAPATPPPTE